jgi:uncharacterized MAPEG superfamily protein
MEIITPQLAQLPLPKFLLLSVAIAAILVYFPYMVTAYGRFKVGFDPSAPRALFDKLPDYAKRASWAHQNSWEVFVLYVAAVMMVCVSGKASDSTDLTAVVFLVSRFLFSIFYILNLPWLRSPAWLASIICTASLMSTSLR